MFVRLIAFSSIIIFSVACGPFLITALAGDEEAAAAEDELALASGVLAVAAGESGSGGTAAGAETGDSGGTNAGAGTGGSGSGNLSVTASNGLVWQKCSAGQDATSCAGTATGMSSGAAVGYCNSLNTGAGFDGRNDWRVPRVRELVGVVDFGATPPMIDSALFPNTATISFYWTLDSYISAANHNFGIAFNFGTSAAIVVFGNFYTRCVAGTLPAAAFSDGGDGTISDSTSGLTWTKCSLDPAGVPVNGTGFDCAGAASVVGVQFATAESACANLNFAGHNDWRLPGIAELVGIVDYGAYQPATNTTFFPQTPINVFWSRDRAAHAPSQVRTVNFDTGNFGMISDNSTGFYRCVRG